MNFARIKLEGSPATKGNDERYSFFCLDCESAWESDPQVKKDYYEYLWLKDRTTLIVRDFGENGSYGPSQDIDINEMMRMEQLAKKISTSYTHLLDINPAEWHDIHLNAS